MLNHYCEVMRNLKLNRDSRCLSEKNNNYVQMSQNCIHVLFFNRIVGYLPLLIYL